MSHSSFTTVGVVVWLFASAFYLLLASLDTVWTRGAPRSYYSLLAEGFRQGHLHLAKDPPPGLLALPNPYDPEANQQLRLHDASLFSGKYYLYFGPVPALIQLVLHWLSGAWFTDAWFVCLFVICGSAFWVGTIALILSRWFPDLSRLWVALFAAAACLGQAGPYILARPLIYEVSLAGSYCFTALFFYCLVRVILGAGPGVGLLTAGSCALGLAIGCRVTAILAAPALIVALLWLVRTRRLRPGTMVWPLVPLAVTLLALGSYNYARFGEWLETGNRFQVGGSEVRKQTPFSTHRIPSGLFFYLLKPPALLAEAPFIELEHRRLSFVPQDQAIEQVAGMLPCYPALVLAFAAWTAHRRVADRGFVLLLVTVIGALQLVLLAGYQGLTMRYQADFVPLFWPATFVAGAHLLTRSPGWPARIAVNLVVLLLFATGIVTGALLGLSGAQGGFRARALGRWDLIHRSLVPVERLLAHIAGGYGGFRVRTAAMAASPGVTEVLASTGTFERGDWVLLRHLDEHSVIFGCDSWGRFDVWGQPVPWEPGRVYEIEFSIGSFFPQCRYVFARWFAEADYERWQRRCLIIVNGRVATDVDTPGFHPPRPGSLWVGRNGLDAYTHAVTRHHLSSVERVHLPSPR